MNSSNFTFPTNRVKSNATFRQLVAAEFCASLSQEMISLCTATRSPASSSAMSPPVLATSFSATNANDIHESSSVIAQFANEVLQDLSAHYGSCGLRRGGSKLIGVPYRHQELLRRGQHKKQHVWNLHKAHHYMCRRCGVWLQPGITKRTFPIDVSTEAKVESAHQTRETPENTTTASDVKSVALCLRCLRLLARRRSSDQNRELRARKGTVGGGQKQVVSLEHLLKCRLRRSRRKRNTKKKKPFTVAKENGTVSTTPSPALPGEVLQKNSKTTLQAIPKGPLRRKKK